MTNRFDELEKHLQDSLNAMEKIYLENPEKFLEDWLELEERSIGGVTCDELIATFNLGEQR